MSQQDSSDFLRLFERLTREAADRAAAQRAGIDLDKQREQDRAHWRAYEKDWIEGFDSARR